MPKKHSKTRTLEESQASETAIKVILTLRDPPRPGPAQPPEHVESATTLGGGGGWWEWVGVGMVGRVVHLRRKASAD